MSSNDKVKIELLAEVIEALQERIALRERDLLHAEEQRRAYDNWHSRYDALLTTYHRMIRDENDRIRKLGR